MMAKMMPGVGAQSGQAVAPPSFVAASTARNTENLTIAKPTGVVDGDLMLAWVLQANRSALIGVPSGWTLVANRFGNSPSVYSKVASSEGADYTFSWSGFAVAGGIVAYRNAPSILTAGVMSDNGTADEITASAAGTLLAFFGIANSANVNAGPSGMVQRFLTSGANPSLAVYDLASSPAGATAAKAITWSAGGNANSVLVQIG